MYQCRICKVIFNQITAYNKHQFLHRYDFNIVYYCLYPNCHYQFQKYVTFKAHIYRNHCKLNKFVFHCNVKYCKYSANSTSKYNRHMYEHIRKGQSVFCPYQYCNNVTLFKSIVNYKAHVFRWHSVKTIESKKFDTNTTHEYLNQKDHDSNSLLPEFNENSDIITQETDYRIVYLKMLTKLYLTLQAKHFLTDSAVQTVISGIKDISTFFNLLVNNKIDHGFSQPLSIHNDFFSYLRSVHMKKKCYNTFFQRVEPVKIILGRNNQHKLCHYYYIPVKETLKTMILNDNVRSKINSVNTSSHSVHALKDISDGLAFKNNIFFQANPDALQIILYVDAFELCNPLGSSRTKHKLLAAYMTLGNIPSHARSKVDQQQLILLCNETHVKSFGFEKIFLPFVNDIKELETEGIDILGKNFKGTVVVILADNLGSHQVGGFNENFSKSEYFCRFCYCSKTELHNGDLFVKGYRTIDNYNTDLEQYSSGINRGVKRNSCFNQLQFYHVSMPGLPSCIAHDLYEGVVPYDISLAIDYFVKRCKYFTYDYLNYALRTIRFSNESDFIAVPIITSKKGLSGNASQNFRTLLILPLAICDKVEKNKDKVWKMILCLREICLLVSSFLITEGQIAVLKDLIYEYIDFRLECFPEKKFKPKHLFMMHYPYLLRQFGPLRHTWTLRFESKHRYFKNIARHSQNFKNITYSLCNRHQYLQALYLQDGKLYDDKVHADSAIKYEPDNYSDIVKNFTRIYGLETAFLSDTVRYKGQTYKTGQRIVVEKDEFDGLLLLSKIEYIFIDKLYESIYFIGLCEKIFFNEDWFLRTCEYKCCLEMHCI